MLVTHLPFYLLVGVSLEDAGNTPPLVILPGGMLLVTHTPLHLLVGVSLEGAGDTPPSSPVPFKSKVINEQLLP